MLHLTFGGLIKCAFCEKLAFHLTHHTHKNIPSFLYVIRMYGENYYCLLERLGLVEHQNNKQWQLKQQWQALLKFHAAVLSEIEKGNMVVYLLLGICFQATKFRQTL